ncbi:hypothetical protein D1BOALGB6SA_8619 [Olavius sp. associated proteobacterium Delta 1]|nr:hypothetical protein D1BOALGB6SA_8619 [Olavius sp. associated proteobacterium Delta 1]
MVLKIRVICLQLREKLNYVVVEGQEQAGGRERGLLIADCGFWNAE